MGKDKKHNKIEWFEKLRLNSWEVEILIVGFVLVMMLQIPSELSALMETLELSSPMAGDISTMIFFSKIFIFIILSTCVSILIVSFSIYLGLRGFWVGLLGFSSVFPDGINIKRLNFNKIFNKQLEKYNFNNFIIQTDHICSSIFSFSFLISFSLISFILFVSQVLLIVSFELFLLESYSSAVLPFNLIFHWPHLLFGIIYFIDYFFLSFLKKIKWKPFGFVYNLIDKFFKYTTLGFIYDTLYYAIISNVKKRILFGCFIGLVFILIRTDDFSTNTFINATYFPSSENGSQNLMVDLYYENKFEDIDDEHILPVDPFINADIITKNYLKLHIPYFPEANAFYKQLCDNIENINSEWVEEEQEDQVIDCINKAYSIMIDDVFIESDFIFYEYSKLGVPMQTFFMLIPINNLDNGKHVLGVYETFKRNLNIDLSDNVVGLQVVSDAEDSWIIPFYFFKD